MRIRETWHDIQASFVDGPQDAVRRASELAAQVIDSLADGLAGRRRELGSGDAPDGDTEQLRVRLTRYRRFVDRALDL